MSRVTLTLSAALLASAVFTTPSKAVEVYLFKGAGDFSFINKNMHFSRGLERIAEQLNKEGIRAEVRGFAQAGEAVRMIKKRRPKSVAFVGHSMGALASMSLARQMRSLGVKVAYVGTLDIPGPIGTAGSNVAWAENYFSITPIYGLLTNTGSHPKARNIHVFGTHTTMDDSKKVKRGVLAAIRKIHAAEGGTKQPEPTAPAETIMVENTKPAIAKPVEKVEIAEAKPLPKIDEEVATVAPEKQHFALANTNSVGDINQRISQAHGVVAPGGEQIIIEGSSLAPINLLAAPATAALSVKQASVQPTPIEPDYVQQNPVATAKIAPTRDEQPKGAQSVSVFDRGKITSVGRKLVSRISGMMARNGKRHERKATENIESQR